LKSWPNSSLIVLIALSIGCARAPYIKPDPVTLKACQAWNAGNEPSQSEIEGTLEVSSDYISGMWDALVLVEPPSKIDILLFDPFLGLEVGRLHSSGNKLKFVYGRTRVRIDIPPRVLVQAILAHPNCSLLEGKTRTLRYDMTFRDDQLAGWTVWRKSSKIGGFAYPKGFKGSEDERRPNVVDFWWEGRQTLAGSFIYRQQAGGH